MFLEVALILVGIGFLIKYLHSATKPPGTPPGELGFPFIGVLPPSNRTFEEYINQCRKKHGDTIWLRMGTRNVVFLCNYEGIVAAFNNPACIGRPDFISNEILTKGGSKVGIIFAVGADWKNIRRFSIRRLRDGGMGKSSIVDIILREAEALAEDMEKRVGKPLELPWSINGSILNVIWKLISDQRFDVSDTQLHTLYTSLGDLVNQLQGQSFLLLDLMPWIGNWTPRFVHNLLGRKSFEEKADRIFNLIKKTIAEHKKTLDKDNPRDLIDSYLIELSKLQTDEETQPDSFATFTEEELTNTIFDLFTAGSETTSSTIRWYLILMAKYPEIQKRVHEELDKVIQKDRAVTMEDKENLPFFEATIHETLRLKPIAPFGIFHSAEADTTVNNYFIPKGTLISPNFLACHKNPSVWEKPNEFYPQHFLKEDKTFDQRKQDLLSFSTGRRVCLGENLARMDLFFVLATLMQRFSFSGPDGDSLSIEQSPTQPFFSIPKPVKLIINKR